ncbi:hypothetical protein ACEV94_22650 [Vibrio parahaemolyticus]
MSVLEKKIGKKSNIHSMPNYSVDGSYCFFSQCIQLDALEALDVRKVLDTPIDSEESVTAALKVSPLLNHEVKHWYDAHSTLWGLELLSSIYARRNDLIEAEKSGIGTDLSHFNLQMKLKDSIDLIKFPEYYSTLGQEYDAAKPWRFSPSFGTLFSKNGTPSDRNICFTRFTDARGNLIARVPFSLCALLEASAVSQEINTKVALINSIPNPVSRALERNKLEQSTVNELYDENLVEYSVVAHKVANSFGLRDAIEAYVISAKLVRFTLNLPFSFVQQLEPQKLLSKQFEVFFQPYKNALSFHDYGAIFSLLVDALVCNFQNKGTIVSDKNIEELIETLLKTNLGIEVSDIDESVRSQMSVLHTKEKYGDATEYLKQSFSKGIELYETLGLFGNNYIDFASTYLPDLILGDYTYISASGTPLQEFENRFNTMTSYYDYLIGFSKACVI